MDNENNKAADVGRPVSESTEEQQLKSQVQSNETNQRVTAQDPGGDQDGEPDRPFLDEDAHEEEEEEQEEEDEWADDDSRGEFGPLDKLLTADDEEIKEPAKQTQTQGVELQCFNLEDFIPIGSIVGSEERRSIAEHKPTKKKVVLTKIPVTGPEHKQQVIAGVRIAAACQHEFIVPVLGIFDAAENVFIVSEYMDSGNLSECYNEKSVIKEQILACLAAKILSALNYLHIEKGLIYRKLNPSNILIQSDGEIKLADFEVSQTQELSQIDEHPRLLHYISPEIFLEASEPRPSCDIWSLGICLLEAATGIYPYSSPKKSLDRNELIQKILKDRPPEAPKWLSINFRDFISKCLNKNSVDRPTANKLLKHSFVQASEGFPHESIFKFLRHYKEMARYKNKSN